MSIDVVGCGLFTGLGRNVEENWQAILTGSTNMRDIKRFPLDDFNQTRGGVLTETMAEEILDKHDQESLAIAMVLEAIAEATAYKSFGDDCGLVMASNFGLMEFKEWCWRERIETGDMDEDTFAIQRDLTKKLAKKLNLSGQTAHLSLSCASGAAAIALACNWLEVDRCKSVIVVCYDEITEFVWCGLSNLRTITSKTLRPFNVERSGTIFGEGAAATLLTKNADTPLATIAGYATNNNAFHMTAPSKDADGSKRVMAAALARAGMTYKDVDVICAHATGTAANDVTETAAINNLMRNKKVPVVAFKSNLTHLMGAAGIAETILAIQTMNAGIVPKIASTIELAPDCDLDAVLDENRQMNVDVVVTNSAGLGGNNASLTLTKKTTKTIQPPLRDARIAAIGWVLPGCVGAGASLPNFDPVALMQRNEELMGFTAKEYIKSTKGYLDPVAQFSLAAAALSLKDAQVKDPFRTAVVSATQYGAAASGYRFMTAMVQKGHRFASPMIFPHSYANTAGNLVAIEFALAGEHFVFDMVADTKTVIDLGVDLIRTNAVDDALVLFYEGAPPASLPDNTNVLHGAICIRLTLGKGSLPNPKLMPDNLAGTVFATIG